MEVELIRARSPQAKGRVQRVLVKGAFPHGHFYRSGGDISICADTALTRNSFSGVDFRPGQTYAGVFPDRLQAGLVENLEAAWETGLHCEPAGAACVC